MSVINPMGILHSFSIFARVFNFKSLSYSHAAQIKQKCVLGPIFSKKNYKTNLSSQHQNKKALSPFYHKNIFDTK